MSQSISRIKIVLPIVAGACLLGVGFVVWNQVRQSDNSAPVAQQDPFSRLDLDDPTPSFLSLQYVAEHGGDAITREMAIKWLDTQSRLREPLRPEQENWLFSMIERGGHADWEIDYKLWIFNSGFNCLHMASDQERYTRLLQELSTSHVDKTMRLYALQHIGLQRGQGHLVDELAQQVRTTLQKLAYDEESVVAGTALVNLIACDGSETESSEELIQLALKLAADPKRSDDIRVTALHSIGQQSLQLSRDLAVDTSQPIHVRKAAIAWIGKHGSEADTEVLQQLARENFRVAQAAGPALDAIRHRAKKTEPRTLISL